jgi:hypothetical protein
VWFDKVVTKATRLIEPHKTRHAVNTQLKACHRGQNGAVLNQHGRGLPHRNLKIATTLSPPFHSECSTDPHTSPVRSSNSEKPISTHHNHVYPSSSKKRGVLTVSGTCHSTSTDGYQLRIAVLVIKIIQLNKANVRKGATMQPITINRQYPTGNAHYITHNWNKIKQFMLALQVLHASRFALLRVKLLKTCSLWTFRKLLLNLLLPRNEPTDVGTYMWWRWRILNKRMVIQVLIETDSRKMFLFS